jgi:hypothetical protein
LELSFCQKRKRQFLKERVQIYNANIFSKINFIVWKRRHAFTLLIRQNVVWFWKKGCEKFFKLLRQFFRYIWHPLLKNHRRNQQLKKELKNHFQFEKKQRNLQSEEKIVVSQIHLLRHSTPLIQCQIYKKKQLVRLPRLSLLMRDLFSLSLATEILQMRKRFCEILEKSAGINFS